MTKKIMISLIFLILINIVAVENELQCYEGSNILPEIFQNSLSCLEVANLKKVRCSNSTSCFAFFDTNSRFQFGCDTSNYCEKGLETRKVTVKLCCESNFCNCQL